jgi:hypothetical protein
VEFARDNFSRPIQTREIMVRNGDAGKAVWAAEYGWVSLPKNWSGDPSPWGKPVSLSAQADHLFQGYLRAQQEWPWMGVMCVWNFRQPLPPDAPGQAGNPTRGFSIVNYDFSPTPAYNLLAQQGRRLDLAYTGAYNADSPHLTGGAGWALSGSGTQSSLTAKQSGATATIAFSGTQLDLLIDGNAGDLDVRIDGHDRKLKVTGSTSRPSGTATRVTVASGLNGGPHQAEIVTRNDDPVTVDGFVVVRRTINAWIYPWIYALLAVVLALNLLSLGWLIRRATRSRGDAIAPGKVRSARELKADRLSSQRR